MQSQQDERRRRRRVVALVAALGLFAVGVYLFTIVTRL